jgi:hypothetical protein
VTVQVVNKGGKRVKTIRPGEAQLETAYHERRAMVSCEGVLQPTKEPLTLLVSTFSPHTERRFQVVVYTDKPLVPQAAHGSEELHGRLTPAPTRWEAT